MKTTTKTLMAIFAVMLVATVLIGCTKSATPSATGTANTPTGDAAGLDKSLDAPPAGVADPAAADPTAGLPSSNDLSTATK